MAVVSCLTHAIWTVVYLAIQVPTMGLLNGISTAIFFIAWVMVQKGYPVQDMILAALETCLHLPLASLLIGSDSGVLLFFLVAVMTAPAVLPRDHFLQRICVLAFFCSAAISFIYMIDHWKLLHSIVSTVCRIVLAVGLRSI